ncbi:MAG: hypothetical protein IPF77_17080 [Gemmatimonadetes bacterium]|nr:hypothetical protein [Gemmatimonadota bacterium]
MTYTTVTDGVDYPQATHINQFATGLDNLETGWTTGVGTWTYASATTITIPAGGASLYAVGDKIKLTQTTVKYFYVVTVADTLLTITGGTSYTLTNAAITSPYFSHMASPVGFPGRFAYSPTLSFTAGTAPTTPVIQDYYFAVQGRVCTVSTYTTYTNAGATVTAVSIPLPINNSFSGQVPYGAVTVSSAANATFASIASNNLSLICTSISANRVTAGASYFI